MKELGEEMKIVESLVKENLSLRDLILNSVFEAHLDVSLMWNLRQEEEGIEALEEQIEMAETGHLRAFTVKYLGVGKDVIISPEDTKYLIKEKKESFKRRKNILIKHQNILIYLRDMQNTDLEKFY